MGGRRNPIRRWLAATAALLLVKSFGAFPLSWSRGIARCAARVVYLLVPRVRKVGMANLKLAFGDSLTDSERKRILKQSVENMCIVAAEFARIPELRGDALREQVAVRGQEHLPKDRGCVVIGAHIGNWEWAAAAMAGYGWKVAAVARPMDDLRLNDYVDRTRRGGGILTIPKARAGREMFDRLKEGFSIGIMVDQSPRRNGVPARFFEQPCWATIGPVMLALRGRVPVHAVSMVRDPDGRYTIEFTPEIPMARTRNLREDLVENVQRCQDAIEAIVRKHPGQWLWLHRRWKSRPYLEKEWDERLVRNAKESDAPEE